MNLRIAAPQKPLHATLTVPSDKSITHRRILFSGILPQRTTLEIDRCGADVMSSLAAIQQFGCKASIEQVSSTALRVTIDGVQPWRSPEAVIDCGNSGTTIRLLMGIVAGQSCTAMLDGDASLRIRPMERITKPLREMGASITTENGRSPIRLSPSRLHGICYELPIPSAQVKSAILAAGLFAEGITEVCEPIRSRDHTERILGLQQEIQNGKTVWRIDAQHRFAIPNGEIPGDLSSAAYWLAAALLCDNSHITLERVGLNPSRTGILELIQKQNSQIEVVKTGESGNEPVGTIRCKSSGAQSFAIDSTNIVPVIDEIPLLAVLAAASGGSFSLREAGELRKKESDRIQTTMNGLRAMGVICEQFDDGFSFASRQKLIGAPVACCNDHRIALSFAIAGLKAADETTLQGAECVAVSYPTFFQELHELTGSVR